MKKQKTSSKPTVWIDLDNSPHVLFFNPIIKELKKRDYDIIITVRDCFQTCGLADLFGLEYKRIGVHYGRIKLLKVIGTIIRSLQLFPIAKKYQPLLAVSHGSRAQLIAAWISKTPSLLLFDYEYTRDLGFISPTWVMAPEVIAEKCKNRRKTPILAYPGIKEDVYVPSFSPNPATIDELGLHKEDFIATIRPPATEAHYHNPESEELFAAVVDRLGTHKDIRMVILPRNEKKQTAWIRSKWSELCDTGKIIIPDHAVNGLDLIWFSDLVISGGGTMNREAAALGVPVYSIFRGKLGAVDKYLSEQGKLVLLTNNEDVETKLLLSPRDKSKPFHKKDNKALKRIIDQVEFAIERG